MKIVKQTTDYCHYDLETTPTTMVIVSKEGIITMEQEGHYVTITKGELKELMNAINNKRI